MSDFPSAPPSRPRDFLSRIPLELLRGCSASVRRPARERCRMSQQQLINRINVPRFRPDRHLQHVIPRDGQGAHSPLRSTSAGILLGTSAQILDERPIVTQEPMQHSQRARQHLQLKATFCDQPLRRRRAFLSRPPARRARIEFGGRFGSTLRITSATSSISASDRERTTGTPADFDLGIANLLR